MTQKRFERLVASYGADISRWPPTERERAERTLSQSEAAWAALGAESRLDRILDETVEPPIGAADVDRLMGALNARIDAEAAVATAGTAAAARSLWPRWWVDAGLYAAMAALGLAIGFDRVGGTSTASWSQVADLVHPITRLGL